MSSSSYKSLWLLIEDYMEFVQYCSSSGLVHGTQALRRTVFSQCLGSRGRLRRLNWLQSTRWPPLIIDQSLLSPITAFHILAIPTIEPEISNRTCTWDIDYVTWQNSNPQLILALCVQTAMQPLSHFGAKRAVDNYKVIKSFYDKCTHGVRHGFKIGGAKTMKVSQSLILIYKFIKLYKILIHVFKY